MCPVPSQVGAGHPGRNGPVTGRDLGISQDTAKDIVDQDDTGIKVPGQSPGKSLRQELGHLDLLLDLNGPTMVTMSSKAV